MAGDIQTFVALEDENDGLVEETFTVALKRRTTWGSTFNASPEPVADGKRSRSGHPGTG
jgi:hypothetical protein